METKFENCDVRVLVAITRMDGYQPKTLVKYETTQGGVFTGEEVFEKLRRELDEANKVAFEEWGKILAVIETQKVDGTT